MQRPERSTYRKRAHFEQWMDFNRWTTRLIRQTIVAQWAAKWKGENTRKGELKLLFRDHEQEGRN